MKIIATVLCFIIGEDTITAIDTRERGKFISETIQYGICPLCATDSGTGTNTDMVQCDICSQWYHNICIGVDVNHFTEESKFLCCQTQDEDHELVYIIIIESTNLSITCV